MSGYIISGEYFELLYQVNPPLVNMDTGSVEIPLPDPPMSEDPLSLREIGEAIFKMRSGEAADTCSSPVVLLKTGDEPIARCLHATLATISRLVPFPLTCVVRV